MYDFIFSSKSLVAFGAFLIGFLGVSLVWALARRLTMNYAECQPVGEEHVDSAHLYGQSAYENASVAAPLAVTDFTRYGLTVNVDGTPMLDGLMDVMGKVYGDSGVNFDHGFSSVSVSDTPFTGGLDLSHSSNSLL